VGLTTLPSKKKIVEKPPRNSAGFCGGGHGLSWAVEPRKERRRIIVTFADPFCAYIPRLNHVYYYKFVIYRVSHLYYVCGSLLYITNDS
jgi:hypothetical protein